MPGKSALERDPEKWKPAFRKDYAQNNRLEWDDDSKISHPALAVGPMHRLAFDGDLIIARGHHAEQQRAADSAERRPEWHEGKEHQHAAIAFEIAGVEDLDPGQPGADTKRGAAQRAQHQT